MDILFYILFTLLILTLLYFLHKFNNTKKNVGQKISFLYNSLYSLLILDYYKDGTKNQALKEEIGDFYNKIVLDSELQSKLSEVMKKKSFLLDYLDDENVLQLYDKIETSTKKTYKNVENSIKIVIASIIIVTILFIVLIQGF